MQFKLTIVIFSIVSVVVASPAFANGDSSAARIQALEEQVQQLRAALDALRAESAAPVDRLAEIERQVGLLAAEIEDLKIGEQAVAENPEMAGFGPSASKIYAKNQGLSIGGYGEWLYENYSSDREDGSDSDKLDSFDALRGILYFGYKFNDTWLLNTEIEYEHASTGKSGEVSLEFAYLDYLYRDELGFRAGLLLVPMGHINELHEPTTFLSAERPVTERAIIPTTWRENGLGIFGSASGFDYRAYIITSLRGDEFSSSGLRGGRQKGSKAVAEDFAFVGRLDYTTIPGLTAGLSVYSGDSAQGLDGTGGVNTTIVDIHADLKIRGLYLRGLYARASLDDVAALNTTLGLQGSDSIGDRMEGYYLEAGYDILSQGSSRQALIPFLRWEELNTQSSVPTGFVANPANDQRIFTLGLAYRPLDQVIFKADYQIHENQAQSGVDQFNVALGYIF